MALNKKKKIILLTIIQSRLAEVWGNDFAGIEFVDPEASGDPEYDVVEMDESELSTEQAALCNALAAGIGK